MWSLVHNSPLADAMLAGTLSQARIETGIKYMLGYLRSSKCFELDYSVEYRDERLIMNKKGFERNERSWRNRSNIQGLSRTD
jgi:hypothetical protein